MVVWGGGRFLLFLSCPSEQLGLSMCVLLLLFKCNDYNKYVRWNYVLFPVSLHSGLNLLGDVFKTKALNTFFLKLEIK